MVSLNPLPQPIVAFDSSFCLPFTTGFIFRELILPWKQGKYYEIQDYSTKQVLFNLSPKNVYQGEELLTNMNGAPVAYNKKPPFKDLVQIFRQGQPMQSEYALSGQSHRHFAWTMRKITADITLLNGQRVNVVMKGENRWNCTMWLDEPKQGGIPIALCSPYPHKNFHRNLEYTVNVAPGIDCALVMLLLHTYILFSV